MTDSVPRTPGLRGSFWLARVPLASKVDLLYLVCAILEITLQVPCFGLVCNTVINVHTMIVAEHKSK